MSSIMEQRRDEHRHEYDPPDFNLREWALKARLSRDNANSRRFSASHIRSFREDAPSFRSNFTISSTASSPGYTLREEIDPSTYSFTTALKALQARTVYNSWECLSPDGFALNSKWNEAEKYICNPLSGEFPMECLSAKTLSGRSSRNFTNRITMSAPLVYNSTHHSRIVQTNNRPSSFTVQEEDVAQSPIPESKMEGMTRDVGTQSIQQDLSSVSASPASIPSIMEESLKPCEAEASGDSTNSNAKIKYEEEVEVTETRDKEEPKTDHKEDMQIKKRAGCRCSSSMQGGCLSWMRSRHREKHKPRRNKHSIFLPHLKGC
ncbi:uncharacterized protein LOC123226476 isoform X2 [Mangifera indica]|uniref:uncharacterized protein LOC123226476 isoform X2 n=1 Tax=Mangifera indica TaxID=29780 RepID=UPI001CF9568B|nr:uncharacterized protein LOC123226476 isoform X2 [Mangifera indica]